MPITYVNRKGPTSWEYTWLGSPPYTVYLEGLLRLNATTATTLIVQGQTTTASTKTPPAIELRDADSTGTAESVKYSPRMRIQWRGQADAALYQIQQYADSAWTTKQVIVESGSGYYNFTATPLVDGTTAQWRVVPQDSRGYEGAAITISQVMVCNPPPPDVVFTYSGASTKTITVSAA